MGHGNLWELSHRHAVLTSTARSDVPCRVVRTEIAQLIIPHGGKAMSHWLNLPVTELTVRPALLVPLRAQGGMVNLGKVVQYLFCDLLGIVVPPNLILYRLFVTMKTSSKRKSCLSDQKSGSGISCGSSISLI